MHSTGTALGECTNSCRPASFEIQQVFTALKIHEPFCTLGFYYFPLGAKVLACSCGRHIQHKTGTPILELHNLHQSLDAHIHRLHSRRTSAAQLIQGTSITSAVNLERMCTVPSRNTQLPISAQIHAQEHQILRMQQYGSLTLEQLASHHTLDSHQHPLLSGASTELSMI